jgi:hypothetical protein
MEMEMGRRKHARCRCVRKASGCECAALCKQQLKGRGVQLFRVGAMGTHFGKVTIARVLGKKKW